MRVLLIGSGAREHALAWLITQSPRLDELFVAPGNAGTADHNVNLDVSDHAAVVDFAQSESIDLIVVGPEAPLVAGIADDLRASGFAVFGPSGAAAQLEGSKAFTRAFAAEAGIPQPASSAFTSSAEAIAWFEAQPFDVVVKADGLAAGKGVIIPESHDETVDAIRSMLDDGDLGAAGSSIVLEERMTGEELSLFGVSDGTTVVALTTAQDHKRVGDGDTGPNTGGMGAFAPVPGVDSARQQELGEIFLDRAIAGMAARGTPYVGCLYAGIMVTPTGPKLVEYNCRFGDPETQVILPLLDGDGLEMLHAAATGTLDQFEVAVHDAVAATVVVAADGYPVKPRKGVPIPPVPASDPTSDVRVFHAGTTFDIDGSLISSGGRVLSVTGTGPDLDSALDQAYEIVNRMTGHGLFARSDIGWRHATRSSR